MHAGGLNFWFDWKTEKSVVNWDKWLIWVSFTMSHICQTTAQVDVQYMGKWLK